jgi:hypothetical protein
MATRFQHVSWGDRWFSTADSDVDHINEIVSLDRIVERKNEMIRYLERQMHMASCYLKSVKDRHKDVDTALAYLEHEKR